MLFDWTLFIPDRQNSKFLTLLKYLHLININVHADVLQSERTSAMQRGNKESKTLFCMRKDCYHHMFRSHVLPSSQYWAEEAKWKLNIFCNLIFVFDLTTVEKYSTSGGKVGNQDAKNVSMTSISV